MALSRARVVRWAGAVAVLVMSSLMVVAQAPSSEAAGTAKLVYIGRGGGLSDGHIHLANPDGTGAVDLSQGWPGRYEASNPVLSPDGTTIAFMLIDWNRQISEPEEIYTMPAKPTPFSGVQRLTNNTVTDQDPAWSPNGAKLVFTRDVSNNNHFFAYDLFTMKKDGSSVTRLTTQWAYAITPAWSPDGSKIAYASTVDGYHCDDSPTSERDFLQIEVMPAAGGSPTNITHNVHLSVVQPDWSPDGTKLAYNGSETPVDTDITCGAQDPDNYLFVNSLDGQAGTNIYDGGAAPEWSPDGSRIAAVGPNPWEEMFTITPTGADYQDTGLGGGIGDWGTLSAAKTATTTTLTVTRGAKLNDSGSVSPAATGSVTVTLFRKSGGTFKEVAAHTVALTSSAYTTSFNHPASGTCRTRANYLGDAAHAPSKKSVTHAC